MDRRTVAKRIRDSGIPPAGTRNGYDVYQLARVAPALLGFIAADATVVDPRDLPPIERRAYYQSENERLEAEQTLGLLVPAAEVEADYADLVKTVVQFMETLPDVLERDCSLAPENVMRVQAACDQVRMQMYKRISGDVDAGLEGSDKEREDP